MTGESLDIQQDQLEKLKHLFPEAIAEGKIDWEKLQATLGKENLEFRNERYVLNWAGKTDAFKVLQQSTTATLKPCPGEGINDALFLPSPNGEGSGVRSENVFIEGENLEVLKVLQKAYYGKIKCIIIDPPYNTGSDSFIYPDSFKESKEDYQKRIGDKDEDGYLLKEGFFRKNSKDSGHYHSNWLSMMYPRLFLAKNLLRDDGVIFIHIDDNEVHNLRLVMNEIFGEENLVTCICWNSTKSVTNTAIVSDNHSYILVYCKSIEWLTKNRTQFRLPEDDEEGFTNPDNDTRGAWKADPFQVGGWRPDQQYEIINPKTGQKYLPNTGSSWKNDKAKFDELVKDNRIVFGVSGEAGPQRKRFLFEALERGKVSKSLWYEVGTTTNGTQELKEMFDGKVLFTNPKPTDVIKKEIILSTRNFKDSIILDFFAGSGTTAQAVLELNKEDGGNRKFILVQLPEKCDENSEAYKAGYKTIADIAKERIRRVIKNLTPNPSPSGEGNGGDSTENLFKGANPSLFENAHQLRLVDKTEAEEKLWQCLRNRKIENCKFRRQHPIGKFVADFYCHEKKLVVEVDGGYHNEQEQKEHDEARTQIINEYGITVIRFTNDEILNNLQSVINKITAALKSPEENSPLSKWRGAGGEVGFKVFKLSTSNFKIWRGNEITEENLEKQLDAFTNPVREGSEKENVLYELILKAGYPLHTPLSKWRGAGGEVYSINDGELIIALEEMNQKLIAQIISAKPKKVITLDKLFTSNDKLKTNTVLQMRDAEIDFKTI